MSHKTTISFQVPALFKKYKALLPFLLFLSITTSCNNEGTATTDTQANQFVDSSGRAASPAHQDDSININGYLHNLYLTKNQFKELLSRPRVNTISLAFVLKKTIDDSTTLAAWGSMGKHQFDPQPPVILNLGKAQYTVGNEVFLGSQDFKPDKKLRKRMENATECPDKCVLYFVPKSDSVENRLLVYDVYFVPDSTVVTGELDFFKQQRPFIDKVGTTNPSPPRSAY